ncbi:MAG: ATP synthase F0 subunit C [Defluviitaleaceae bacterium]|jgi:F-type H+-transporting ATPase subunit c|nr:ATP synthase F0 subunit C [Defluviitaleaceae bacterium]
MHDPLAFVMAAAQIAVALALWTGIVTTLGQGKVAAAALESIARQPEAKGVITTNMIIGCGFAETGGVYGVLFGFLLLFANPIVNNAIEIFSNL